MVIVSASERANLFTKTYFDCTVELAKITEKRIEQNCLYDSSVGKDAEFFETNLCGIFRANKENKKIILIIFESGNNLGDLVHDICELINNKIQYTKMIILQTISSFVYLSNDPTTRVIPPILRRLSTCDDPTNTVEILEPPNMVDGISAMLLNFGRFYDKQVDVFLSVEEVS